MGENANAILKTYKLFIRVEVHQLTHSFCKKCTTSSDTLTCLVNCIFYKRFLLFSMLYDFYYVLFKKM